MIEPVNVEHCTHARSGEKTTVKKDRQTRVAYHYQVYTSVLSSSALSLVCVDNKGAILVKKKSIIRCTSAPTLPTPTYVQQPKQFETTETSPRAQAGNLMAWTEGA